MKPEQHFREFVEQCCSVNRGGVRVCAMDRERECEVGTTVGSPHDAIEPLERSWLDSQMIFDRLLWAEGSEERRNTHHDERRRHGLGTSHWT